MHCARTGHHDGSGGNLERRIAIPPVDLFAHQIENYDTRADLIGMLATYFGDSDIVRTWLEPYAAASPHDLDDVAARYLTPNNRVTSLFVPAA